ncbi:hypothetical protein EV363DRAFT_1579207 [Boletus edulis]|nr:hypothetical protein EV363DRAFT_1579207 [Boletus edulis]
MRDSVRHSQLSASRSRILGELIRISERKIPFWNTITRESIIQWVKSQTYSDCEGAMPPRKKADKAGLHGSATSAPSPQQSTSTQPSSTTPPSSVPSKEGNVPELRRPRQDDDGVPTFCSHLSCSKFAATSEQSDYRMFRWMFDRRVIPQCLPSDLEFREEYSAMTSFIWPDTWHGRKDLPLVDAALEPCVQELLKSVATLKTRPGAVQCIPAEEFPVDLRILQQSFSAIFQASRRSREKGRLQEKLYEAAWRHDHDRLLFDFFIRLVQPSKGDDHHIADLEDPLSRPTLETTLRLPKSDNLQTGGEEQLQELILDLLTRLAPDHRSWLRTRGGSILQESDNSTYVVSQFNSWRRGIAAETEDLMISKLGQFPPTGRCDSFGRLLVELPNVPSKDIDHLALVDYPARERYGGGGRNEVKASVCSETSTKRSKVEYKKVSDDLVKGTNQLRMYLTASVKFLQAVGIRNVPVYGVQTDGSVVVLPAAVLRDDNFVYLFERLVERLDISTPAGAWHYATILCRLAQNHAKVLENKFEGIKEKLIAENKAKKPPPQEKPKKQKSKEN